MTDQGALAVHEDNVMTMCFLSPKSQGNGEFVVGFPSDLRLHRTFQKRFFFEKKHRCSGQTGTRNEFFLLQSNFQDN